MQGNKRLGSRQEKPAGSMATEVTARDKSRWRPGLETVISSALENDVQLWGKKRVIIRKKCLHNHLLSLAAFFCFL